MSFKSWSTASLNPHLQLGLIVRQSRVTVNTSLHSQWAAQHLFVAVDTSGAVIGSGKMQQVPYGSVDRDKPLIRVPFTRLAVITVCLPLLGLIACVVLAILYHYNDATYTHCQVRTSPSLLDSHILTRLLTLHYRVFRPHIFCFSNILILIWFGAEDSFFNWPKLHR